MPNSLTIAQLCSEAEVFSQVLSEEHVTSLYGVTDGKAIGTYLEHNFSAYLEQHYEFTQGSSAKGIDFPDLQVDIKVTKITLPQSSCPYRNARQKIYGLGYSLLVFVYEKYDDPDTQTGLLHIVHTIFIDQAFTADYQTTTGIQNILKNDGNTDDIIAFLFERHLPVDDIEAQRLADEIIDNPPTIGYLTISNALQWRLQYRRAIEKAGQVTGLRKIV